MRQLARFEDESSARKLADALYVDGIDNAVQESREGAFVVWVHDEAELDRARAVLEAYELDPTDARFETASRVARERRRESEQPKAPSARRIKVSDYRPAARGNATVTLMLIAASVAVAFWTGLGEKHAVNQYFTFASYRAEGGLLFSPGFKDILSGQVWRIVTPIFLHFGMIHLIFNMWWLKDLGAMIETLQGSVFFVILVTAIAVISNTAQFWVVGSPMFGGMSGVVYGLFGYVWMKGRFDPGSGYGLPQSIIIVLMAWFVICWTGLVGPIANVAHTAGLGVGMLMGISGSRTLRRRLRRR